MAPFAGVSVVVDGDECYCLESAADGDAGMEGSGYHLMVLHGAYTRTGIPTGRRISSHPFKVGGTGGA